MAGYSPTRNFTIAEQEALRVLTAGLPTKSAKIRALDAAAYSRAEIAAYLSISYQHVRSVLGPTRSNEPTSKAKVPDMVSEAATPEFGVAKVGLDARIELPEAALEALRPRLGGDVAWRLEGDDVVLMGRRGGLRWAQDLAARQSDGDESLWSEELIADRRAEAAEENAKDRESDRFLHRLNDA